MLGVLELGRMYVVEGRSLLGRATNMEAKGNFVGGCGGAQVAQRRGVDKLCDYELLRVMCVCVFRQFGIAHVIQTSRRLDLLWVWRVSFS